MKFINTNIVDSFEVIPEVFNDERGYFYESFRQDLFNENINPDLYFVQDNHSFSSRGVLRGLHYQVKKPQGKLIRVIEGRVFDVIVDLRLNSPSFLKTFSIILDSKNPKFLWVPPGCAHGFQVISETAHFLYKVTDYRYQEYERTLMWNVEELMIKWPNIKQIISEKDINGYTLVEALDELKKS